MSMDELERIIKPVSASRTYKKGAILLYQGEIPRRVFLIRHGLVRAYTITNSGEERTVTLHGGGDIFPLTWVFGGTPNTMFYYEAMTESEIITAGKSDVLGAIKSSPIVMESILNLAMNEYTAMKLRITALVQSSAAEKIAFMLYYLMFRHGQKTDGDNYAIDIKMTQSLIASLVGLTRESTAVNLKLLKKKGIVSYGNFNYTVNKARLERFVGEDSFKDIVLR